MSTAGTGDHIGLFILLSIILGVGIAVIRFERNNRA